MEDSSLEFYIVFLGVLPKVNEQRNPLLLHIPCVRISFNFTLMIFLLSQWWNNQQQFAHSLWFRIQCVECKVHRADVVAGHPAHSSNPAFICTACPQLWRQQCLIKTVGLFKYDSEKFQRGRDDSRKQFVPCAFLFVLKHVLPGLQWELSSWIFSNFAFCLSGGFV